METNTEETEARQIDFHDFLENTLSAFDSPTDRAAMEEILKTQASLLRDEWTQMKAILLDDNEVGFSFAGKLKTCGARIQGEVKISYSRKFGNEAEPFITPDFDQADMFNGTTVKIKAGDTEATMTGKQFQRLANRAAATH